MELWTAFDAAPEPAKNARILSREPDVERARRMAEPEWIDESLDFKGLSMVAGKAFHARDPGAAVPGIDLDEIPVAKRWLEIGGAKFLVESLRGQELARMTAHLPKAQALLNPNPPSSPVSLASQTKARIGREPLAGRSALAAYLSVSKSKDEFDSFGLGIRVASMRDSAPGVVWDYTAVTSQNNMTLSPGTWYVSSSVNFTGTTTIWGGAVVKYDTAYVSIICLGPIVCKTEPGLLSSA